MPGKARLKGSNPTNRKLTPRGAAAPDRIRKTTESRLNTPSGKIELRPNALKNDRVPKPDSHALALSARAFLNAGHGASLKPRTTRIMP